MEIVCNMMENDGKEGTKMREYESIEKEIAEIRKDLAEIRESLSRVEESIAWIKTILKIVFSFFSILVGVMVAVM